MYSASKGGSLRISTASKSASALLSTMSTAYQSFGSPVSVTWRTVAVTLPPDTHCRSCGRQAAMRWPRRWASRIIEKVVSL